MRGGRHRPWVTLGKALLTLVLIAFLVSRISLSEALHLLTGASVGPLLGALGIFALSMLAGAWQWGRFLAAGGIALPFPKLLELYWVGLFFNNFLPSNVGGDFVKVLDLSRARRDPVVSTTATLADRLTGFSALACLALLASWRLGGRPELAVLTRPLLWGSLVFLLFSLGFLVDPLAHRLRRLLEQLGIFDEAGLRGRILEELRRLRRRRGLLLRLFLFSLLIQTLRIGVHYLAGKSLVGDSCPPFADFFLVIPPLAFALTLPITLGGLGLREGLAIPLFGVLGLAGEAAVAIELLAYLLMLAVSLVGGIIFLARRSELLGKVEGDEKGVAPPGTLGQD